MKQIEDLIELLNEYAPENFNWRVIDGKIFDKDRCGTIMNVEMGVYVISKQFGFIKWLVDNDKIDVESYCRITSVERKGEKDVYRDEVDSLLMLLAIQDKPIEFLISILK